MNRLISLLIGYVSGSFLTAEVVSHRISGKSVFDMGTGNPGMANVVNQYGVKYGILVLAGDLLKTFVPCLLCRIILFPELGETAAAYAGLGAVLIPAAFMIPAFCFCGSEVGILAAILTLVMLQRHMPGLKNIPTGTEPRKDLLKALKRRKD